jgi:hypothetical protein
MNKEDWLYVVPESLDKPVAALTELERVENALYLSHPAEDWKAFVARMNKSLDAFGVE